MARSMQLKLPRWSHFIIPLFVCGLVIALRLSLESILGDTGPFYLAALAVTISAFIGGLWPGLLATVISTLAGVFVVMRDHPGRFIEDPRARLILGGQITVCVFISMICGALRSSEIEAARFAEQEKDAREKLDALFNSITDKFMSLTPDLKLISFNRAAADRWQIPDDAVGKSIFEVLPNSITGALKGPLVRTVELQEAVGVEVYDDISARTYEVRSFWSPEGILVYFHNITDRIRANEAITQLASEQERANALLDSLLTHAPLGFAFVDSDGHIERVNSQFETMAGISADSALGREIHELFPSFGPLLEKKVREVFESGQAVEQMELSDKSGIRGNTEKHWQAAIYPVSSLSGETRAVGTVLFDISNRKQMEEQLRESEGRFRGLADNAPLMIWVCDREGKGSWFNRLWLEFRNLTLVEAVAEGSFAEVHPDDQPWVTEAFHNASMAVEPFVIEYRLKDYNQEYRWIHVKANPIASDGRNADTYLFSGIDVTERIAMEENLRRSLANERIARSESDEANRLKDEFLASLSHELRTPLTSMLGWAELLNKPKIQQNELAEGLSIIQRSCKLQLQLINDLLDMSRINIGKLSLEFEFVELFDLTQSVVDMIRSSAADKNIELRLTGGDDPVIVRADPDRFVQIIWNLLTNAIKFTPSGGAVAVNVSKSGSAATLSVTDTGIGVDEKDLPMIFDRFRQVDSTRSRRHGGLGLGLTIAKHLTELHHGKISARSHGVNCGSTFSVEMPLADANVQAPSNAPRSKDKDEQEDPRRLVDLCLLLVEDDPPTRELLKKILEVEGAVVIPAGTASTARRLLRETSPDVMISDIGLPNEDGFQLMRSIRSLTSGASNNIPSIALTAFAGDQDRTRAFESGFNIFLTKPIEPDDLVRSIMELCRP